MFYRVYQGNMRLLLMLYNFEYLFTWLMNKKDFQKSLYWAKSKKNIFYSVIKTKLNKVKWA